MDNSDLEFAENQEVIEPNGEALASPREKKWLSVFLCFCFLVMPTFVTLTSALPVLGYARIGDHDLYRLVNQILFYSNSSLQLCGLVVLCRNFWCRHNIGKFVAIWILFGLWSMIYFGNMMRNAPGLIHTEGGNYGRTLH